MGLFPAELDLSLLGPPLIEVVLGAVEDVHVLGGPGPEGVALLSRQVRLPDHVQALLVRVLRRLELPQLQ